MIKKKKQLKKKQFSIVGIGVLCLVFLFGSFIAVQSAKADISFKELLAEKIANSFGDNILELLGLDDFNLGGAVHNVLEKFDEGIVVDNGVKATNESGFDIGSYIADGTLSDGFSERLAVISVNATSSGALVNPESETIYVYDATARIQTATGTVQEITIGTSSVAYVAPQDSCGADGTCAATTAGDASILQTGDITASTAANTTYFKADYEGTDTRDGSGTRYIVPVLSGEYLTCAASSTIDIAYGAGAFQCQVKYYVIED